MNDDNRISIEKVKYLSFTIENLLNEVMDYEQETLDNIPDNLQYSSRADELQENISSLEESINLLADFLSSVEQFDEPKSSKGKKEILNWNIKLNELMNERNAVEKIDSNKSEEISRQERIEKAKIEMKKLEKKLKKMKF